MTDFGAGAEIKKTCDEIRLTGIDMALNFPNRSRTYDQRGSRVQFWGHDGAFEICFFIEQAALGHITPDAKRDEGGFLKAFDRNRDKILEVAAKLYSRCRRDSYTLLASDF